MCKNEKEKVRKNKAKINEKKKRKSENLQTSIRRAIVCLYQKKMT